MPRPSKRVEQAAELLLDLGDLWDQVTEPSDRRSSA